MMTPVLALATFFGIHLIATISPGPAVLSTVQVSIRNSRRSTAVHALGLGIAIVTWALVTLLGLNALMIRVGWLFHVFQILGGIYLVYIGAQSWRHAKDPLVQLEGFNLNIGQEPSTLMAFRRGYLTNIGNPKVMVFFGSIFSAVLTPSMPNWVRFSALGIVLINEAGWNFLVGMLLSTPQAQRVYARTKPLIDRAAGTFMTLFGLRLIYQARQSVTA